MNQLKHASIGIYIDLPPDLKNSKSILNIRNSEYAITAWLYPAINPRSGFLNNATRESKYVNNLIEARQRDEYDFAYIIRIPKKKKITFIRRITFMFVLRKRKLLL